MRRRTHSQIELCRPSHSSRLPPARLAASCLALCIALVACGNYDGEGDDGSVLLSGSSASFTSGSGSPNAEITPTSPLSIAAYEQTLFPVMRDNCESCHAGSGPGSPSFAHFDVATAHFAAMQNQKVYLGNPISSRMVQRLAVDLHYCWGVCGENAEEVRAAIEAWAILVDYDAGATDVGSGILSSTQTLSDGAEIDPAAERYNANVIAMYEFKEGSLLSPGNVAADTSGVAPAMDLQLDNMTWMASWGIENVPGSSGKAIATAEASRKLYDRIASPATGSNQYTIEAWVVAANISQDGPARMVSYSQGTGRRNFTMGQIQYNYVFRNRNISALTNNNGSPALETYDDDRDLQATLQHAVLTYEPYRGRSIYVNGVFTGDLDEVPAGPLWNWDPGHRFVLGNETSDNRLWLGKLRYVAIHNEALSPEAIAQNYRAGVGRRIVVQFDVSAWTGAGTLVEATISELDDYSYMICEPAFLGADSNGIRVRNMRVAVNGVIPVAGQAFTDLDVGVFEPRQTISGRCTIVPKDLGPSSDTFSLEFEYLGSYQNIVAPVIPPVVPDLSVNPPVPVAGIRAFDRINNTMAALTGVDPAVGEVRATFDELTQQLPGSYDLRSFVTSQQVGISKLALEYCDSMVESPTLRDAFFGTSPAFGFDAPVATAFANQADKDLITGALVTQMIGTGLQNQPDLLAAQGLLDTLIDDLNARCASIVCDAVRSRSVVKAACAALLSSSAVTIH